MAQSCRCEKNSMMTMIWCFDSGLGPPPQYAHNIYGCNSCGMVMHESVWDNKGKLWIYPNGRTDLELI